MSETNNHTVDMSVKVSNLEALLKNAISIIYLITSLFVVVLFAAFNLII